MKKHTFLAVMLIMPLLILAGAVVFRDKQYAWISLGAAVLCCVPFFAGFEKRGGQTKIVIIAVMIAFSVIGRIIFAPVPAFKPVTAMVVITGIYFGREAGFMTGALSAVISNFYFGQGPWTPFQMLVWGLIGALAGLLSRRLEKSRIALICYGALSGVAFSLLMDVWTVLWIDGSFVLSRYAAALITAWPFTLTYAVSNVIFLLILNPVFGKKLKRIKLKYGI